MKKIIVFFLLLSVCFNLSAQKHIPDFLEEPGCVVKIKKQAVITDFSLAFPMHFGWSVLTGTDASFPGMNIGKSFNYALDICSFNFFFGKNYNNNFGVSFMMDFVDFCFADGYTTISRVYDTYVLGPVYGTDGKKSKFHGSYIGIPLRYSYEIGDINVYASFTAELLLDGYDKVKSPDFRTYITPCFNQFRGVIEAGISYHHIGMFVNYSTTPLFTSAFPAGHNIKPLTFGIILGL